jgi:hypothetical protein
VFPSIPKGEIVERLVVEKLVVIELLKDWLSLISTLEHEVNKFYVKLQVACQFHVINKTL